MLLFCGGTSHGLTQGVYTVEADCSSIQKLSTVCVAPVFNVLPLSFEKTPLFVPVLLESNCSLHNTVC